MQRRCAPNVPSPLNVWKRLSPAENYGGFGGGELIENGRVVVGKRGRGRPRKQPQPVLEVNEVPIPPELIPA